MQYNIFKIGLLKALSLKIFKIHLSKEVKSKYHMRVVRPRGFEPLTYGLEGRCFIQLSCTHHLSMTMVGVKDSIPQPPINKNTVFAISNKMIDSICFSYPNYRQKAQSLCIIFTTKNKFFWFYDNKYCKNMYNTKVGNLVV